METAAYLRRKLFLYCAGDATAEPFFDDVYHEVGDGIYAAHAIDVVTLRDQVPCLKLHLGIAFAKVVKIIPVCGGGLTGQQTRLGQQVTACADTADACARAACLAKLGNQRGG